MRYATTNVTKRGKSGLCDLQRGVKHAIAQRRPRRQLLVLAIVGVIGAAVVHPLSAQLPGRKVALQLQLGTAEGSTFGRVAGVAVSKSGIVYVLDVIDANIRSFTLDGRHLRTFGRRGGGPGEFTSPSRLRATDSTVQILDAARWSNVMFSANGEHLRTVIADEYGQRRIQLRSGSVVSSESVSLEVVKPGPGAATTTPPPQHELLTVKQRSGRLDTLATIRLDLAYIQSSPGRGTMRSSGFGRAGAWETIGDTALVVVDGYSGIVRWFRDGSSGLVLDRTRTMGVAARGVTADDIRRQEQRIAEATLRGTSGTWPPPGRALAPPSTYTMIGAPPKWSVATTAIAGADGAVWVGAPRTVARRPPGLAASSSVEDNVWTVFPPTGNPFTVSLPSTEHLQAVHGELLFCIPVSSENEPTVNVYRLLGSPSN